MRYKYAPVNSESEPYLPDPRFHLHSVVVSLLRPDKSGLAMTGRIYCQLLVTKTKQSPLSPLVS